MRPFYVCNLISLAIWIAGFGYGLYCASEHTIHIESMNQQNSSTQISEIQKEIIASINSNNNHIALKKISTNNLLCCIINIGGGSLFSIPTIFNLPFYGYVLGFQIHDIIHLKDNTIRNNSIRRILPHSFEIVGIWLSGSISFYITWIIICLLRNQYIGYYNIKILIKYTFIMCLIIIIAAIIETYISPYI